MRQHALALAALFFSVEASAELVTVQGVGLRSCGKWTTEHKRGDWEALVQDAWIGGFLSGYNVYSRQNGNIAEGTDFAGMLQWVSRYCEANPLDTIADAAMKLVIELDERRRKGR